MDSFYRTNFRGFLTKPSYNFLLDYSSRHHNRLAVIEPFKPSTTTTIIYHQEEEKKRPPVTPPTLTPSPPQYHRATSYVEDFYLRRHNKHFPFNNSIYEENEHDENGSEKVATLRYLRQKHFHFNNSSNKYKEVPEDEKSDTLRRHSPPVSSNHHHHPHRSIDINGNDLVPFSATRTFSSKEPVSPRNDHILNHRKVLLSRDPEISSFTAYCKTSKHRQHNQQKMEKEEDKLTEETVSNDINNSDISLVHPSSDRSFMAPPMLAADSKVVVNDDKISAAEDKHRARPKQLKTTTMNEKPKTSASTTTTKSTRQFSCKYCDKDYMSLGALKMHIRTHTLPCKCNICGKAFSRPWLLQGHIRTHTGERPFGCSYCGRAFADRSNLRAHIQTHTHAKKHECCYCSKTFSRASLLKKHEANDCLVNITRQET